MFQFWIENMIKKKYWNVYEIKQFLIYVKTPLLIEINILILCDIFFNFLSQKDNSAIKFWFFIQMWH